MESGSKSREKGAAPPSAKSGSSRFSRQRQSYKQKYEDVVSLENSSSKREGVVEIDPKVFEPYLAIPGRTPRKIAIERKKKSF